MLQVNRHRFFLLLFGLSLLLGGCAKEQLPRFVWPPPPDEPRLEFVGNYYSESSFEKSVGKKLFEEFVGAQGAAVFSTPFGITSDGKGRVFVSDIHLKNLRVFDFNKRTVNFLVKETFMVTPLGLTMDRQGNLYIADAGLQKILVYDPDLRPKFTISNEKELVKPAFLAINEGLGRLYVSDGFAHKIVVFSLAGDYLFSFGGRGKEPGQFFAPQGLAFGPDGNLYVADSLNARIQALTPDGEFVRMFGERGDLPNQFENPKSLAFDSAGNLHVLEGRRSDLLTYTPEGKLLLSTGGGSATSGPFGFGTPRSIWIDANDRMYIAEATNKRFSIWQYMGAAWLAEHPYTEADRQRLLDYMEKLAKEQSAAH